MFGKAKEKIAVLLIAAVFTACSVTPADSTPQTSAATQATELSSAPSATTSADEDKSAQLSQGFTGYCYTGVPELDFAARFEEGGEILLPTEIRAAFIKDADAAANVNGWLAEAYAELSAVRDDYIAEWGGHEKFPLSHGRIFSKTTYETLETQFINGYMSVIFGYVIPDGGADRIWYDCRTAVFDLDGGRPAEDFSELFSGEYSVSAHELFTLTTVVENRNGVLTEVKQDIKNVPHSKVWHERDFSEQVTFAVRRQKIDNFSFGVHAENGVDYVIPTACYDKSDEEMAAFSESRLELAREFAAKYEEQCGRPPETVAYSCYNGDMLTLQVGGFGSCYYVVVKENGAPLTLADCISGGNFTISTVYQGVTVDESCYERLSEYYVYSYYEKPETIYLNAWSYRETTDEELVIMDITAERESVSEYCIENFVGY